MSPEPILAYQLNELNTLYPQIKRLSNELDPDHLGKLSFIQSSNDLLNRILSTSVMPDFDMDSDLINVHLQEQIALIQSIQDIHLHAQKVKRAFRKVALEVALEDDFSDQVLTTLSTLTLTLCLLFQHLNIYQKQPALLREAA